MKTSYCTNLVARQVLGLDVDLREVETLEMLALTAPSFPTIGMLSFDIRWKSVEKLGQRFADIAAIAGFFLVTQDPLLLQCVTCESSVSVEKPEVITSSDFSHLLGCQYERVLSLCSREHSATVSLKTSLSTSRLKLHVKEQLLSSKGQVARELGFDSDLVCTALAKQFLLKGQAFSNAAALIDCLSEYSFLKDKEAIPIIDGVAGIVCDVIPSQKILKASYEDLRTETCAMYSRTLCRECHSNPLQFVVLPCSHLALCDICVKNCDYCPTCKEKIVNVIRYYRS